MATVAPTAPLNRKSKGTAPSEESRPGEARTAFWFILPAVIVMALITFFPIIYEFWLSVTDYGLKNLRIPGVRITPGADLADRINAIVSMLAQMLGTFIPSLGEKYNSPAFVGLQNFVDIATGEGKASSIKFFRMLAFNLVWTFINVAFHVTLGIAIAIMLNTKGMWFKRFYRALYILPWAIPVLVTATVWKNLFDDQFGFINQMLKALGLFYPLAQFFTTIGLTNDPNTIRWLSALPSSDTIWCVGTNCGIWALPLAFFALLISNIWLGWAFMMVVATGALASIPGDMYEAAALDGASGLQSTFSITLPLLRPAMVPAAIIGIIYTFNAFNVIYFISAGGPLSFTEILVTQAYKLVNVQQVYGLAAAFALIVFFVLIIITVITNRVSHATDPYYA